MSEREHEPHRCALYILGAGFSRAAGLPLGTELWAEVARRGLSMQGRASKFRRDLENYIEFKRSCDGQELSFETVDFEDFLGFLDVEHYLGLRGSDTWSYDGNEGQIVTKTLIGQILTEKTPRSDKIPQTYVEFAKRLQPYDTVITFNYDILLERALEAAGVPYRLFPDRFESVGRFSAVGDPHEETEVVVLKMHGSVDWFDKGAFIERREHARSEGYPSYVPSDPVFNRSVPYTLSRLVQGPRFPDDPLNEIHRVREIDELYRDPPWFRSTPVIINPSAVKLIYSDRVQQFWYGMNLFGAGNLRLAIIGYSLPYHDQYVRQSMYRIVRNFQRIPPERMFPYKATKEPLIMVDRKEKEEDVAEFKQRYSFVAWDKTELYLDGFDDEFVARL